ncbi:MAG: single-stranded DNA-binding protein [Candidatus Phytoplasma asteris]|uniref:Single-stranded DNA-binding protein n=2 Tax=16SrI (Aster yellows group) TaxID=3042590 RepID=Q6YQH7_ONYPE|nr:single-stranded DNA-binding protein ['Chrysanthemum coronarium' phytoplasma]TKA88165.1 MAG: single-stranded DNA-binding protein [Periwinkle leaf yellowing phytoplasma]WEX19425.1 MAG: single-stranded DNA-binding protein [Candidatus Phytoplasma asteris]BAD04481.1 single-stranded DNA-binding protein [Onion yellows phytoplasma OY-M]GAK74080.1 single-stranded DNA-binding protein ['Chrysanthemum coronarium' phytoplasma]
MLNKVQLIGRIIHDLEKQYINSNNEQIPKIDFQLAVNLKEITQFIPCVVFRKQAENMKKYLHKGSKIYLEGLLSIQKYTNNEGQTKINTKVILQNVIFLDNKPQTTLPF